jgi:DNA-binding LacI/PurR family transcriptional regulator
VAGAGAGPIPELTVRCHQLDLDGGHRAALALLTARPEIDAIMCHNDLVAIGALRACADLGLKVPHDVAVAGADDIMLAALVTPSLTTLRADRQALGATALRMLLGQLRGVREPCNAHVFQPELVVRASAP